MPTDVIIDPSNGQIYWNDGTGSPQSISLGGNAQDTISVTGYAAVFTPGSTVGGTTVLVRFKDSALETLAPGTNGYELGSSTLRWKLFATTGNFSDSTNSTSLTSGAFQIQGGTAVSGNASFGQTVLFWTPGGVNYIGFRAPASAGNTTYVLPSAAPISGATGTSVLSSDQSGILSWVPMTSGSAGAGSSTVSVIAAGVNPVFHPILFTPTSGSSSGAAVSSNTTLFYQPSTEILYASGIWVTSTTVSSNQGTGAVLVAGGMGVSGQINAASMQIAGNAVISGNLTFNGVGVFGNATTDTINSLARYISDILPSADNTYDFGNGALGWRNTYFSGIGTFAGALRVSANTVANSSSSGAFSVVGGVGIQGNAFIGGTVNITSTNQGAYGSTTAGALVVAGTVGVGLSMYIGGQLGVGGTLDYNATGNVAYFAGNNNSYTQVIVHNHNTGNNASSDFIVSNDSATDTTFFGDFGMNSSGWAATTSAYNTANAVYLVSNSGDLALGSLTTNAIRFFYNNSVNDAVAMGAIGMTVYYGTTASSTGTGALQIRGGVGITGNAFIGGTSNLAGAVVISDTTTSISTTTGSLVVTGGVGIGGSLYVATTVPSSISGIYVANGVLSGSALTATANVTSTNVFTTNIRTTASTLNIVDTGTSSTVLNYNGSRFGVLITANSTSSSDGGFVVTGGAGFGASINVNGNIGARSGYELRAFNSGDTAYSGFRFTGSASTTYILPVAAPAIGNSVLQSSVGGIMSWVPMTSGSGSPGGNNTELQFNNGGTFGGATGITYESTRYLVSIASTADQRAVTTVGLRLVNNATVSAVGAQQRYSPALEIAGKTWTSPTTENFNRFLTEVVGTIGSYGAQQQWKYSLDTGTPVYTNPVFVIHSQKGVGIGYTGIAFQNFFRASATQAAELTYVLPVAYPGTGTSVLSSNTTGDLSWVPATTGGSGTPGGSNRQIQYNNSTAFGGATGFEYVSAGNAVTVSYFSAAGGGNTVGMVICAINATTTRVGIGLTNPAYELEILGEISATNKSFVIDHPTKPGKKLRYGSLEGPENGVYCRGILNNENIINTPDHWTGLVDPESITVTLTPIQRFAQLYVIKIEDYKVYIADAQMRPINCYYTVWAERKDIPKLVTEY